MQKAHDSVITLSLPNKKGNARNSEGSFLTLADGRIMFTWSRYRDENWADNAIADIAARFSSDGGETWTPEDRIIVENEGVQNVMSTSMLRLQDGRIALFYLRTNSDTSCVPWMRTSTDEGETWVDPVLCASVDGYYCLLNNQAVQLKSGRIVLTVSSHGDISQQESTPGQRKSCIVCFLSDDAGRTWRMSKGSWVPQVNREPHVAEPVVVELNDGRLHCYARTGLGRQWESFSEDQGETWSEAQPSRFRSSQSPMDVKRIPQTGDLVAVWNDLTPRWGVPKKKMIDGGANDSSWGRTPLVVAVSRDEGKSWRYAQALETDPYRGFCYPAMHFTDDSMLLAYCCGGPKSGVLQDLCIRKISIQRLYSSR